MSRQASQTTPAPSSSKPIDPHVPNKHRLASKLPNVFQQGLKATTMFCNIDKCLSVLYAEMFVFAFCHDCEAKLLSNRLTIEGHFLCSIPLIKCFNSLSSIVMNYILCPLGLLMQRLSLVHLYPYTSD